MSTALQVPCCADTELPVSPHPQNIHPYCSSKTLGSVSEPMLMWALLRAPNLEQLWLADLREPSLALQLLVMLAPATGLAPKLRSLHLEVCESLEVYVTLGLHSKLTKLELFLDSDCEEEGMGAMKELRGLEVTYETSTLPFQPCCRLFL